jgi:flagellar basal body-associated protein FliL
MQRSSSKQDGHVQEDADPHDPTKLSSLKKIAAAPAVRKRKSFVLILVQFMIILMLGALVVPITAVSSIKNNSVTGIKAKRADNGAKNPNKSTPIV